MHWIKIKRDENGVIDQRQYEQILDCNCEQVLLWDSISDTAELCLCHDTLLFLPYHKEYTYYIKIEIPKTNVYNI